ncbi:diketogulonate reductase-like aldo/keto reductase [Halanaerobium saccharolyticum]|uniref:Diketogulonate reductase-like aldo/keto reductase n=1 Tax=Halanaerobium saccharolyticum TaxID=43595 RepID=A0A4R7Z358_9FIRM|nr:aldo/keto reductase [Halanaerobium saccharolyticum]RAK08480.1 diketogulonate reductase-like aldo/keto reductase [Halanaerobium saccharolyticum]TDW03485.1 diketogulonate reductase-like aldo/keto reductase [Halanaerobium saccharolyticum]TDX59972.1 diketogulonate reductase-like aldo/keto reductase [Halanaerobium saccharolyticum]
MKQFELKNGNKIPALGLGTSGLRGEECTTVVKQALELGYRHIDTADMYGNHRAIAEALNESDVERNELFITSKIQSQDLEYKQLLKSAARLLTELDIKYFDLLLIHWPNPDIPVEESLKAMQELKEDGRAINIGVSNFTIPLLKEALEHHPDLVTVNQVEFHPTLYQKNLLDFAFKNDVILTAYSPLAQGEVFNNSVLKDLGEKYDKTPAQLALRWLIEKDIVAIPKASSKAHLKNNLDVFDWNFPVDAAREMELLDQNNRLIDPGYPDFD